MTAPLISIRNLCVDYITDAGDVRACNNVSFDLAPGEVFGLAGEQILGIPLALTVPQQDQRRGPGVLSHNQQSLMCRVPGRRAEPGARRP